MKPFIQGVRITNTKSGVRIEPDNKQERTTEMNFTPLNNYVLIKIDEAPTETATGLIIPEQAQKKPTSGKVIAVADGVTIVKKGATVFYQTYSGHSLTIEDQKVLLVDAKELLGVVK